MHLISYCVYCPYCGESFEVQIDPSVLTQEYIEDCYVCCQPIIFLVTIDGMGELVQVEVKQDNE